MENDLSYIFNAQYEMEQGEASSLSCYKMFIKPILETYKRSYLGCHIGPIHYESSTVTDEITKVSSDSEEIQTMFDIQENYTCTETHTINHTKSQVLQVNNAQTTN